MIEVADKNGAHQSPRDRALTIYLMLRLHRLMQ